METVCASCKETRQGGLMTEIPAKTVILINQTAGGIACLFWALVAAWLRDWVLGIVLFIFCYGIITSADWLYWIHRPRNEVSE